MLLKWILCHPLPDRQAAYDAEQAAWNQATFEGEDVQAYVVAGTPGRRLLLIEWPDQGAIDRFMQGRHDTLMRDHPLGELLRSYEVAYYEWVEDVGLAPDWERLALPGPVLRHTLCEVPAANFDAFLAVQRETWSPGMLAAPGFLGGRIWRRRDDPARVLVATYFADAAAHAAYQRDVLPRLRVAGAASIGLCTAIQAEEWRVGSVRWRPG
ncbi:MAG: hypothetical protein JWM80_2688 [Cyanobacteria bacterium RYN_339]|nr:hypothetical protein [Cyanobacteria bacterium RYN_339]